MAKIYISSTYEDLKNERQVVAQAIRRMGHRPIALEEYITSPEQPVDKCLQDLQDSDAYVGIFAWCYGFIPTGYDKSITHLEFEAAKRAGIPCLLFILDPKAQWPVEYVPTGEERQKIDQFREELMNEYIAIFFKNTDELSGLVSAAVSNLRLKNEKSFSEISIGAKLGKYQILKILSMGSSGYMYKVMDTLKGKEKTIKMVPPCVADPTLKLKEVISVASIDHPNVISILGVEEYEGKFFIVMEYIEGKSLEKILAENKGRKLKETDVIDIMKKVANGLLEIHKNNLIYRDIKPSNIMVTHGGQVKILDSDISNISYQVVKANKYNVIHRDIKPKNIMLDSGTGSQVKVIDFGISPLINKSMTELVGENQFIETWPYMAPEQLSFRYDRVDKQVDIWGFGVTMYQMLTGQLPFKNREEIIDKDKKPFLREGVSKEIRTVVMKCLEKDRKKRFQNMDEIIKALEKIKSGDIDRKKVKKVFISYSRDSQEHCDLVLAFSNLLRKYEIDAVLDQYEACPPPGWHKWMDMQIKQADFILNICSERYWQRVDGIEEEGRGLGVYFDSTFTYNHIYFDRERMNRFIPVLFNRNDFKYVPTPLKGFSYYCVNNKKDAEALYRRLKKQLSLQKPELGRDIESIPTDPKSMEFSNDLVKLVKKSYQLHPDVKGREDKRDLIFNAVQKKLKNKFDFKKELIATGTYSQVYLIHHRFFEDDYALKIMNFDFILSFIIKKMKVANIEIMKEEFKKKCDEFITEAKFFYKFSGNPNILHIYEADYVPFQHEKQVFQIPYLISKYIKGVSLKEFIHVKGPLELDIVLYISEKILSAINSIHEHGFFYLNLNPEKILIEDESKNPILIDAGFPYDYTPGFEYDASTRVKPPEPKLLFNAISYLSPIYRKRKNKELRTATVICLFGVLLYEMVTGEREILYKDNVLDTLYENLNAPVSDLKEKNPNLTTGIVRIIKKSITKNYRLRYRNVKRVLADLLKVKRKENVKKFYNNDEIRLLIKDGHYWEAISGISNTEKLNFADDNTRALKEKVIKSLSDDEEQSFKKTTKQGRSINYPDTGSTPGRDETIGSAIEILDKTPIITVYGIPGIGKSVVIHKIRKSEPHNNRLYKRFVAKPDMTVNDLFQQLAFLLGCRDMLDSPEFDLSTQPDFSFLETEAQYRVASLIHLDDTQNLFHENQFRNNAVKEFLEAITRYYPETRIILESRIVPPAGVFPGNLHRSIRLHGIDKGSMIIYFKQPLKNNPGSGWELEADEQELVQKNLGSREKENIHPLAMALLANRAYQSNKRPLQILKDPEAMKELIAESGDLILNDLNQTTLQAAGANMSQNIEMYREDIPAYLSERLQESIRELTGDAGTGDLPAANRIVDEREDKLRIAVSKKLYKEGQEHLQEIIKLDKERKERLQEEFGYIYDVDDPEADENQWAQKQGQIEWRRKVWRVLSSRNKFELPILDKGEAHEDKPGEKIDPLEGKKEIKESQKIAAKEKRTPGKIGDELEKAALKLFKDFFELWEEDNTLTLTNARQQGKGLQFGHDLKFVRGRFGDKEIRFLIECKNYSEKITTTDIADKLMQVDEYYEKDHIDHWILISPNEDVSNELENFIEKWEKKGKFSFKVQAWTPATRVKEFFGLNPDIYDKIIKAPDLEIHPKDWSEEKRQEVIGFWKQKLEPPLRLPPGWEDYLRQPGKLQLEPKEKEFEKRYNHDDYVKMNCKDETGAELAQTLEEKIYAWLEEPVRESPTLFLLGEFGDGKTFFTYVLTRKLVDRFRETPGKGWLPVRFALKNFPGSFDPGNPKNIKDFLQLRLDELRADIAGWNEIRSSGYKILAILDGFDEISKELDPETIQRNIHILINFYENDYFSDMKILITSRKHFFENYKEKEWLIDKLDKPQLLHLAPIDRKITEDYLRKYAARIGKEEKFNKLKDFHDPIGLASKPLFLEMVQVSLESLPEEDLNEYRLYETYIMESLKRKEPFLQDKRKETRKIKIIANLLKGLELVAQELHRSRKEFVYLSEIKGKKDLKEWLWTLSESDEKTTVDETGRMAARSLLKRFNVTDQPKGKSWPVDFCHRSMREYFAARAVCHLLENDMEEAETFLIDCFLTHEILFFAGEIMEHRACDYESRLLDLIRKTRNVEKIDRIKLGYLGGNAVNLLYKYKGKLPGNDWQNLVLEFAILPGADLSGKDFSGTSLQYANLDNVNFSNSNFTNCILTEVRIEETTPVQSIALSTGKKILSLYHDGIIREWSYQRLHGASSNNLSGNKAGKDMKLMALPGNDLTVLHDRFLYFYDRNDCNLDLKAAIEINPNIRLIKATRDYLLLNEEDGRQNRLLLVDLNKEAIVKSFICTPFTLCDHLDDCALVIFNQDEELQLIDITPGNRTPLIIPTGQKVACISTCKCGQNPGQYLLGLGLYTGAVQVWQIQVSQWKSEKILDQLLHEKGKPVKDICFIDECCIVSGGLDKTIKLLTFTPAGEPVDDPKEFKMTLQCQGMKVDGVIRDQERKRLQKLIDKATK